jgi:hypothetical protein
MDVVWTQKEHFLTQGFKEAMLYMQPFHFDLSQLDKRDFSDFIQIAFEPEFTKFLIDFNISNIYINKKLRPVFNACKNFVQSENSFASDYYHYGHIGLTHIHVCEQHFFDDDWILFLMGFINQKYGKVCTSGLIRRSL